MRLRSPSRTVRTRQTRRRNHAPPLSESTGLSHYFAGRNLEHLGVASQDSIESEWLLRKAVAIYDDVLWHETWRTTWCQSNLALYIHGNGRTEEALTLLQDSGTTFLKIRDEGHGSVGWVDNRIHAVNADNFMAAKAAIAFASKRATKLLQQKLIIVAT